MTRINTGKILGAFFRTAGRGIDASSSPGWPSPPPRRRTPARSGSSSSSGSRPRPNRSTTSSTRPQFQLHTLLTEQRHPKTWSLGERIADGHGGRAADALRRGRGHRGARSRRSPRTAPRSKRSPRRSRAPSWTSGASTSTAAARPAGWPSRWRASFWRPVLAKVKAERDALGEAPRPRSARPSRTAHRRDDRRRPRPHQLARRLRGPAAHRPAPARRPEHPQGRRRDRGHRRRRDLLGHRDGPRRARRMEIRPGLRSGASRKKLLFRLQQPRRPAPALRPQPRACSTSPGITKINLTTGPAGDHRLDPDAGDDERDVRPRRGARDGGRAGPRAAASREEELARRASAANSTLEGRLSDIRRAPRGGQAERAGAGQADRRSKRGRLRGAGRFSTYFAGRA